MPVAFPSHQGLVLPLWRWLPGKLDGVALCVGAAIPDVVEVLVWPIRGGELGQGIGHSLVGVVAMCLPLGLVVTWLVRRVIPRRFLDRVTDDLPTTFRRDALSLVIGALSHDLSDLITHCNFVLFWPWMTKAQPFPAWFCRPWARIPLLVYREPYPLAPHTIVWFVMSVLGAWLFFRCLRPRRA